VVKKEKPYAEISIYKGDFEGETAGGQHAPYWVHYPEEFDAAHWDHEAPHVPFSYFDEALTFAQEIAEIFKKKGANPGIVIVSRLGVLKYEDLEPKLKALKRTVSTGEHPLDTIYRDSLSPAHPHRFTPHTKELCECLSP
jgi:hypothetical protein